MPDSSVITSSAVNISDYVLVTVHEARSKKNYVAMVTAKSENDVEVDFFVRVWGGQFIKPDTKNQFIVDTKDIVLL